jgi:dTDP-4-dehydrorhamnose reductase
MRIVVTGASGLLGKKVASVSERHHQVVGTSFQDRSYGHQVLDLRSAEDISPFLDACRPEAVIHTAALTDVARCEAEAKLAKRINADATSMLARWCEDNGAKLVYVSSDYVFDGESGPYREDSEPYPVQIYGYTKLLGEMAVLRGHRRGAVVRVGILHGMNDRRDKRTVTLDVLRALRAKQRMVLDHGRIKYPTLIDDVADALLQVIADDARGIFHVASQEPVTRYEWALRVARAFELDDSLLVPDPELEKDVTPRRPVDVRLIDSSTAFAIHGLDQSLAIIRGQLRKEALA